MRAADADAEHPAAQRTTLPLFAALERKRLLPGDDRVQKVAARGVAAALGKALFWDMQVGSDGVQSCGSCHFNAGADDRTKNQLNPNHLGGDLTFQIRQPNQNAAPQRILPVP